MGSVVGVVGCAGPLKKKARVKWESKLQQISCPQMNVLYEVSEYLAGMFRSFVWVIPDI